MSNSFDAADDVADSARAAAEVVPMVPSRIAAVNGVPAAELQLRENGPEGWTLRREYRNTWRDTVTTAETVISGKWWDEASPGTLAVAAAGEAHPGWVALDAGTAVSVGALRVTRRDRGLVVGPVEVAR